MSEIPKVYKTKGKKPRYFIIVNGRKKYIKPDDPDMSEKDIIKYIKKNFRIRKKPKKRKTKKAPPVIPPSITTPVIRSSVLPASLPVRPSLPATVPVPTVSSTTTKQDIPEITNLLGELRTYKDMDKKRQEENKRLEIEKKQLLLDKQNALLEKQRAEAEAARAQLNLDRFNKQARKEYDKAMKKLEDTEDRVKKTRDDLKKARTVAKTHEEKSKIEMEKLQDDLKKLNQSIIKNAKENLERLDQEKYANRESIYRSIIANKGGKNKTIDLLKKVPDLMKKLVLIDPEDGEKIIFDKSLNTDQLIWYLGNIKDSDGRLLGSYLISDEDLAKRQEIINEQIRLNEEAYQKHLAELKRLQEIEEPEEIIDISGFFDEEQPAPEDDPASAGIGLPNPNASIKDEDEEKVGGAYSGIYRNLLRERQRIIERIREIAGSNDQLYGSGGLWTNQINTVMQKLPNFLGTIASDQFDQILAKIKPNTKSGWITNLDPSTQGGSHWVAFVVNGTASEPDAYSIMYYDPFGEDIPYDMLDDVKK